MQGISFRFLLKATTISKLSKTQSAPNVYVAKYQKRTLRFCLSNLIKENGLIQCFKVPPKGKWIKPWELKNKHSNLILTIFFTNLSFSVYLPLLHTAPKLLQLSKAPLMQQLQEYSSVTENNIMALWQFQHIGKPREQWAYLLLVKPSARGILKSRKYREKTLVVPLCFLNHKSI